MARTRDRRGRCCSVASWEVPASGRGAPETFGATQRFDLVIFDCDGVLVDSERLMAKLEAQICREGGWGLTEEDIVREFVGLSDAAMGARLVELVGEELPVDWDVEYTDQYRQALARDPRGHCGVAEWRSRQDGADFGQDRVVRSVRWTGLQRY